MRSLVVLLAMMPAVAVAQSHLGTAALDSIALQSARYTDRYTDRRVAQEDGYRRLSADFPGMGEHWISPRALLRNTIDPSNPALLIYANVGGKPKLFGVGFVVVTQGATDPSPMVPGWPEYWHEHSGLLSDESGVAPGREKGTTSHVWVLHMWTVLENPAGRYAPDNWKLPFAREGLDAPSGIDADAARAFSLVTGGDKYLRDLLSDAGLRDSVSAAYVDAALRAAKERVTAVRAQLIAQKAVTDAIANELRITWASLADTLRAKLGARVDEYMRPPHGSMGHR